MELHRRTRRLQHLAIRAVFIALAGIGLARPVAAAGDDPTIARIRSTDPSLAVLIDRAATQSPTFQRLVATIQRSNGMVQVEAGPCSHGVRACLLMWLEMAASNRFLRIYIDRRHGDSDVDVMASMGHELQHAVEALSEPGITDSVRLFNFFGRLAPTYDTRFETKAGIYVGNLVREELRVRRGTAKGEEHLARILIDQ
jgi:hypothetical protein